jgi:hypothetical protein
MWMPSAPIRGVAELVERGRAMTDERMRQPEEERGRCMTVSVLPVRALEVSIMPLRRTEENKTELSGGRG